MAKPSLNYYEALHVGKVKTDVIQYTTIQGAIDAIGENGDTKPYAVYVHPGTYTEKVTMEDYVDLIATGGREETVITYTATSGNEPTVTGENSMIKGFTIVTASTSFTGRCVENATAGFEMEDCVLTLASPDGTETTFNTSVNCDIRSSVIDSGSASSVGLGITGGTVNVDGTTINSNTDAVDQTDGTLSLDHCVVSADIELSTNACTLSMYYTRMSAGAINTAAAEAKDHDIDLVQCDLANGGIDSDSTGATTMNAYGCSHMGELANAGSGAWECRDSDVGGVNFTSTGTLTLYGGDLGSITKADASVVWWRDSTVLYVLPSATTADTMVQYAVDAASAAGGGQTIYIGPGTFTETVVCDAAADVVTLIGKGTDKTIITMSNADTLQVTNCGTVCVENLTLQGTGMDGDQVVNLNGTTAHASLTMRKVLLTGVRTANSAYGVYTQGGGDYNVTLTLDDCDVRMQGAANTYAVYSATTAGTGLNIMYFYNSFIEAATDAGADCGDSLNISADGTVYSYNTTYSVSDINLGDVDTCIMRSHNDTILCAITKAATGIMTCQEKPNIWRVYKGMEIHDAYDEATAGDAIEVGPGSYTTALTITKVLNLVSTDGPEVTTITRSNETPITAGGAFTIDGFTINVDAPDAARTCLICTTFSPNIKNCIFNQTTLGTAGYGVTVTTGAPTIDSCVFGAGFEEAITQADGDTVIRDCTISSGATAGVSITDGLLYISRTKVSIAGTGLRTITNDGIIWADHCDITGTVIDCNVAANCGIFVDCCSYNDVTNAGTFVDLTGCREYNLAAAGDAAINDWVYVDANDQIKKADASDLAKMPAIGVVVYKPTTTTAKVKNYGYLYCSSEPWTENWSTGVGVEWFVDDTTAGEATRTMPAVWPQRVGVVVSDVSTMGRFKILIGDNLGLINTNIYDYTYLTPMQGASAYDAPAYADETTEANEATADDMTLWPLVPVAGDAYYFGAHREFTILNLTVGTVGAGGNVCDWEYWNGAWVALSGVTDSTDAFNNTGTNTVTFDAPVDWLTTNDGGNLPADCYWIRAISTTAGTQSLGTQAWTNAVDCDDWVYITTTDDTAAPALATVAETMPAIGVVVEKMATDDQIRVKTSGKYAQETKGWTAGDEAWISNTTVGDIVNVCPVMGVVQKVADVKADPGGTGDVLVLEIT